MVANRSRVRQTRETRIVMRLRHRPAWVRTVYFYDFQTVVKLGSGHYSEIEPASAAASAGDRE